MAPGIGFRHPVHGIPTNGRKQTRLPGLREHLPAGGRPLYVQHYDRQPGRDLQAPDEVALLSAYHDEFALSGCRDGLQDGLGGRRRTRPRSRGPRGERWSVPQFLQPGGASCKMFLTSASGDRVEKIRLVDTNLKALISPLDLSPP